VATVVVSKWEKELDEQELQRKFWVMQAMLLRLAALSMFFKAPFAFFLGRITLVSASS